MSRRVLVVSNDHVGSSMAGPGIRAYKFAVELAKDSEVTLVVPFPTDLSTDDFEIVEDDPWDGRRMNARIRGYDAVVSQFLPISTMHRLARSETVAVYDLYTPWSIEDLALWSHLPPSRRLATTDRLSSVKQAAILRCGHSFICASERQRDLWLGALLATGRVDRQAYALDPSLRNLVDVVPFGIDAEPAHSSEPVLRGVVRGIEPSDRILLWGGGVWNWFDPLTLIRAVDKLSRSRDDVRLYFSGLRHPNPTVPRMELQKHAVELATDLGLLDRSVFFNSDWVPYEQRGGYFLEADVGVSAHFDSVETRFAFRTRLLDYFWSGLPVVSTRGDALADLVERRRLGRCVDYEDVDGWVRALDEILDDEDERASIRIRLDDVRRELAWSRVVEPLRRLIAGGGPPAPGLALLMGAEYVPLRLANAVHQHGARGAASRAIARLTKRTPPASSRTRPPLP